MSAVLGFNAFIHDTAAALVVDGRLTAMAEEERFVREKHTTKFPDSSIEFALRQAGITVNDLDAVAFYWNPWEGFGHRVYQTIRYLPGTLRQLTRMQLGNFARMRSVEEEFRVRYRYNRPFFHVNHYEAHAAGAFYPSPFDDALILIIDGNGEIATTWFGIGEGERITPLGRVLYPHSLGLFYCTLTEYLGFKQNRDEGKVMGLSAYGDDRYVDAMRRVIRVGRDGHFELDLGYFDFHHSRKNWFSPRWEAVFGPPRRADEPLDDRHKAVARAGQTVLEESVKAIVRELVAKSGKRRLAYAGGVALNCVLNGQLLSEGIVDELYVPPPAYDAGAAWGAALRKCYDLEPTTPRDRDPSPYQGPEYSQEDMEQALRDRGLMVHQPDDPADAVAAHLADGKIVGRFAGRMEIGPRALGHRSILADPRTVAMKDHLNARVKHREAFRPFGPSVLAERAAELFDTQGCDAPFMLQAFDVRPEWRDRLGAVTHVDGTARIQTVSAERDPDYDALIRAFDQRTGVPCVVNTSFNVMGEPIVNTPEQAVECFLSTGIDILALGPYVVAKSG
ncbi:MAG: carbamoyl transferase [Deltaproteobacteria bacterium]|nr:carbamoyl transferase [Deltaproteobacteria bacterium]MCB9478486.1 carbamoyl transferase [Deltaproteobacteria bacterium]